MPKGFYYIASPYSSGLPEGLTAHEQFMAREERYHKVMEFTAWATKKEMIVFSPILQTHEMAKNFGLPKDAAFWKTWNDAYVVGAVGTIVLKLGGWDKSLGVLGEIDMTRELGNKLCWASFNPSHVEGDERFLLEWEKK